MTEDVALLRRIEENTARCAVALERLLALMEGAPEVIEVEPGPGAKMEGNHQRFVEKIRRRYA